MLFIVQLLDPVVLIPAALTAWAFWGTAKKSVWHKVAVIACSWLFWWAVVRVFMAVVNA